VVKVVGLNFSSATTPELLLKTLDHYCEYRKTPNGMVLSPVQVSPTDPEYNFTFKLDHK
jgi:dynein heavy chain 1